MTYSERQAWADVGRGFAIITIVFFHTASAMASRGLVDWKVWLLVNVFAPAPIALFFFISGLFSRKYLQGPWRALLGRRVVGLLYVFAVWSLIETGMTAIVQGGVQGFDALAYVGNPQSTLWFIWALALFTVAAKVVLWRSATLAIVVFSVLSVLSFSGVIATSSFVYDNLLRFFPFFLGGAYRVRLEPFVVRHPMAIFAAGSAAFAVLSSVLLLGSLARPEAGFVLAVTTLVALPTAISGCALLASNMTVNKGVGYLGRQSFGIYLVHPVLIAILVPTIYALLPTTGRPAFAAVFGLTLLLIASSAAFFELTRRLGWIHLYVPPIGSGRYGETMASQRLESTPMPIASSVDTQP